MDKNTNYTWINNCYWYIDNISCITVSFNEKWFNCALPYFEKIWKTIEKERISGFEHRKPKKRTKKPPLSPPTDQTSTNKIVPPLSLPKQKMVLKMNETLNKKG